MQKQGNRRILAVLEDLLFMVKIGDAAKRVGLEVKFLKSEKDVLEQAAENPLLIIVDLNCGAVRPLNLLANLKGNAETRHINTIGFVSHVQGELKQAAQDTGCDMVLARSAFSQNLPQILKRYASAA